MRVAQRLVISGRVQGVGFRYFTQVAAAREGVAGWVRNRPDGRVEAYVEGESEAVARVERAIRQGPEGASVHAVEVDSEEQFQAWYNSPEYQAIRQLRGRWLTSRGRGTPRVHVDGGARQGGVQELQNIRVSEVQEVEFMGAADATLRFGTGYEAGAILVTTRRR